jgi:ribosomal protein S18 acetylase RimI-like enzyme
MEKIISINKNNTNLIDEFIKNAGDSLSSFRYFEKRSISFIENHLYTCVLLFEGVSVGYGHLDYENKIVWLGIALAQDYTGKGFGKKIMLHLINFAEENNIKKIRLSVDLLNFNAINLYKNTDFKVLMKNENHYIMEKKIK